MDDRAVSTVQTVLAETRWLPVPCPTEYQPALARDVLYALEQAGFGSRDERTLLAQRLYVAMVEQRNLEAQRYGEFQTAPIEPREATALLNEVAAVAASQLRGLVAWWRQCGGDESFKQGLNWCAAQLDLALDGKLPSPISQSEREIDDDNLL